MAQTRDTAMPAETDSHTPAIEDERPGHDASEAERADVMAADGTELGHATVADRPDGNITTRLRPLYGDEGLTALAGSRVLVFGLGGVGSSCVEALARGFVGELYLVDRDVVDPSNLNRQALAFECTVGWRKVDVMREMVGQINPRCHVACRCQFVTRDNLPELLAWAGAETDATGAVTGQGRIDYVVDAIDTVSQKLALAKLCWDARIPLVSSMGAANKLHPELFQFADVRKTRVCRLSRTMRKECARRSIRHLEVLYSPEESVRPHAVAGSSHGGLPNLGTASFMPPIAGQMVAGRVIRALTGFEPWRWAREAQVGTGQMQALGLDGTA